MSSPWEMAAAEFDPPDRMNLHDLGLRLDKKTRWTPALRLIEDELNQLVETPDGRLIISVSPQEGKTSTAAKLFPISVLRQWPHMRIVNGSYGHTLAARNTGAVRDAIIALPELGLRIRQDASAKGDWQLDGHPGGMFAAGIETSLTGRPADLVIIDDPHKDMAEADSATMRDNVWDWWLATVSTRLAPGAPVVLIMTRWHEDDLAGRLLAGEDGHLWRVVNIPAIADHDPEKGESDPLGREPGEYMESARGRTKAQWDGIKKRVGSRVWEALYQGRPSPAEGGMFQRVWWPRFEFPMWIEYENGTHYVPGDAVEMCLSADFTFKGTDGTDFVVIQCWMRRDAHVFLLDQIRGRMSFTETCSALRRMAARWPQAAAKYVEDKANGPAVMNALHRTIPGLIPVQPEGSKEARAAAVTPFVEAGNVWLPSPEIAPWVEDLIEEAAAFPRGTHDDQVDALSQAINRLLLNPWGSYDDIFEPDEYAWADEHPISRF